MKINVSSESIHKLFDIITWKLDAIGVVLVSEEMYELSLFGNDDINSVLISITYIFIKIILR